MEALAPGDPTRLGDYTLLGRLGSGGMGRVYLGRTQAGYYVAVKVINARYADVEDFRRRFAFEVDAARKVSPLYTAHVADADTAADMPWIAFQFIPGPSLQEAVSRHGPLPPDVVRSLACALAEGLDAIHRQGIIHRDLHPSNVLLTADGPRIIDFGVARDLAAGTLTRTGERPQTALFMSPEHADGKKPGRSSDVFSLGSVLTFAATGRSPFAVDNNEPLAIARRVADSEPDIAAVPDEIRPLIAWCLQKDPAFRPTTRQLLDQLGPARLGRNWLPRAITSNLDSYEAAAILTGQPTPPGGHGGTTKRRPAAGSPVGPPRRPRDLPDEGTTQAPPPPPRHRRRASLVKFGAIAAVALAIVAISIKLLLSGTSTGASSAGKKTPPAVSPTTHLRTSPISQTSPSTSQAPTSPAGTTGTTPPAEAPAVIAPTPMTPEYVISLNGVNVNAVAYNPAGTILATGNDMGVIGLRSATTYALLKTFTDPGLLPSVSSLAFSPTGLLAAGDVGSTYLYALSTGHRTTIAASGAFNNVTAVAFGPDGTTLAFVDGNAVRQRNLSSGRQTTWPAEPKPGSPVGLAFSPDGASFAVGDADGSAYIWNVSTQLVVLTLHSPHSGSVNAVAYSSDGKVIATGADNGAIYLWNAATGSLIATLRDPHSAGIESAAFNPAGTKLAVADGNGKGYVWSLSWLSF